MTSPSDSTGRASPSKPAPASSPAAPRSSKAWIKSMEEKRKRLGTPGVETGGGKLDAFGNLQRGKGAEAPEQLGPPEKKRKIVLPVSNQAIETEKKEKVVLPVQHAAETRHPSEAQLLANLLPLLRSFLGISESDDPIFSEVTLQKSLEKSLGTFGVDRLLALPKGRREDEENRILERAMNLVLDGQFENGGVFGNEGMEGLDNSAPGISLPALSQTGSAAGIPRDYSDAYVISDDDEEEPYFASDGNQGTEPELVEIGGIKVAINAFRPVAVPTSSFYPKPNPSSIKPEPKSDPRSAPTFAQSGSFGGVSSASFSSASFAIPTSIEPAPLVFESLPPEPALESLKFRVWTERGQRENEGRLLAPRAVALSLDDDDDDDEPSDRAAQGEDPEFPDALDVWKHLKEVDLQPPGLKCTLLPHQVVGVRWMLRQEQLSSRRGGILADDMGLGKTIQTLALILSNPPAASSKSRTTLVVCPLGVLGQWVSELSSKTYKSTIKVGVHHPSVQKLSAGQMQLFDVVLTSYEMVGRESPHPRKAAGTGQKATRHGSGDSERGPLFRTCFHRIILDEAHLIKNPSAERTRAVWELQGGFRWCLSGTPIQNNVGDLYPLLRFLGLPEFPTKEAFDKSITSLLPTRRSAEAMMRLHSILQRFCLRRRKDEQSPLGQPLLNLPQRTIVVDQEAEFTEDERRFYDAIRRNTRRMFAGLMKRGTVMRNFSNVLTRILRERQAADDFRIIKSNFTKKELGDAEAISSFEALLARIFGDPTDQDREKELERARKLFSKSVFESLVLEGRRANADGEQRNRFTDPCPLCRDLLDSPMVTKCGHVFCKDCINGYMADDGNKEAGCPADECGTALKSNEMVSVEAFYVPVKSGEIGASQVDEAEQRQDEEDEAAIRKVLSGGPDCGAKILRLLELLEKQQAEKPGSKAIVFSSFTSMLGLCARALKEKGIGFAQYDGSMPPAQRDAAVRSLNKDPRTLVLLVSLKAGGVGLNLTAASRAYLLDIWYNPQVDSQAIDRIHRIGQTENVVVTRITIKDTIEESIARLQERKARLARGALGDDRGGAGEANRLTIRDLAELFGAAGGLSV